MKKLFKKNPREYRKYSSMKALIKDASQKKLEVSVVPRLIRMKVPDKMFYILQGQVEMWVNEIPKVFIFSSFQIVLKLSNDIEICNNFVKLLDRDIKIIEEKLKKEKIKYEKKETSII
jgi:hypothetical protein